VTDVENTVIKQTPGGSIAARRGRGGGDVQGTFTFVRSRGELRDCINVLRDRLNVMEVMDMKAELDCLNGPAGCSTRRLEK
jgi:hypothetical protein